MLIRNNISDHSNTEKYTSFQYLLMYVHVPDGIGIDLRGPSFPPSACGVLGIHQQLLIQLLPVNATAKGTSDCLHETTINDSIIETIFIVFEWQI